MAPRARKTAQSATAAEPVDPAPVVEDQVQDADLPLPEPDPEPEPEPEPDPEPDEPADAPVAVDRSGWAREDQVMLKLPHAARVPYAVKLLEAADHLGYPREAVRSQSDGYRVPLDLHRYLFPSEHDTSDEE
ncbi:MAG: hypothetical protein LC792_15465 [Actinobacteria bacterium]|nr:hypothetical protein [Actinomycetota bacterium]